MKYVWKFDVVNRPSKEKDGVTNVSQDFTLKGTVDGEVIAVGSVVKSRGNASYVALDLDGTRVDVFTTRSKAAHALRKHRVAKATVTTEPAVVEPVTTETVTVEADDVGETTAEELGGEAA